MKPVQAGSAGQKAAEVLRLPAAVPHTPGIMSEGTRQHESVQEPGGTGSVAAFATAVDGSLKPGQTSLKAKQWLGPQPTGENHAQI